MSVYWKDAKQILDEIKRKEKKKDRRNDRGACCFEEGLKRGKRNRGGFISGADSFPRRRFLEKMPTETAITKMGTYILRALFKGKGDVEEAKDV